MSKFILSLALVVLSTSAFAQPDRGDDLTPREITRILYLSLSCAQYDRVVIPEISEYNAQKILNAYFEDLSQAGSADGALEVLGYLEDVYYAEFEKLSSRVTKFDDALTGKKRVFEGICSRDTLYSEGAPRGPLWYSPEILKEYGESIYAAAHKWNIPVTGMIFHGITESNMMLLLSRGNCKPKRDKNGDMMLRHDMRVLCEAPLRPDNSKAWTVGQPGIDYGAWQISYSMATRGLSRDEKIGWVRYMSSIPGSADIAGKWWHRASQCPESTSSRYMVSCPAAPLYSMSMSQEEWKKKAGAFKFCSSCRGSYKLFGHAVAYFGLKFEDARSMRLWEERIKPAIDKVRAERVFASIRWWEVPWLYSL